MKIMTEKQPMKRSFVLTRNIDTIIKNMIAFKQWENTPYKVSYDKSLTNLLEATYLSPDINKTDIKSFFENHLLRIIEHPEIWIKRMHEHYIVDVGSSQLLKTVEQNEHIKLECRQNLCRIFKDIYADIQNTPCLENLQDWSIRMQSCRELLIKLKTYNFFISTDIKASRKDAKVYQRAALNLLLDSKENMSKFYYETHEIRYRKHVHDKRGKLINVEASFINPTR